MTEYTRGYKPTLRRRYAWVIARHNLKRTHPTRKEALLRQVAMECRLGDIRFEAEHEYPEGDRILWFDVEGSYGGNQVFLDLAPFRKGEWNDRHKAIVKAKQEYAESQGAWYLIVYPASKPEMRMRVEVWLLRMVSDFL